MIQTTNRILKSDEVEIDGSCHLDIGHAISSAQPGKNNNCVAAKARIFDNTNEYAMIELICSCGKKTLVRCEYNDVSAANQKKP